jgi:hypothetical protein
MNKDIAKYTELIQSFQDGRIGAKQFEQDFLFLFKNDEESVNYSEQVVDTLDTLFGAVDEYCDDKNLRMQLPKSIDENGLLNAANLANKRLNFLIDTIPT